jgi:hypothetical protein
VGGAGPQPAAPPAATGKVKVVDRVDLLLGLLAELDDVSLLEQDVLNGHLLLLDTVSLPLSLLPAPLARLDARRGALEWFVFNRRGLIQAVDHAGFEVEAATRILRDEPGVGVAASWGHRLGILGPSCAIRARPANL